MSSRDVKLTDEVRISTQKLYFLERALQTLDVPTAPVFGTLLKKLKAKRDFTQTISFNELLCIYSKLAKINIPGLATQIGCQIACGDYGLYGCTLLSKRSLEEALTFSIKYHSLVTRTSRFSVTPLDSQHKIYTCMDILLQPEIRDFNEELQIAINLTLIREVLGDANFAPIRIDFSIKRPNHVGIISKFAKCDLRFEQAVTGIVLTHEQLSIRPDKSNPLALPLLLKSCDEHILDFMHRNEVVEGVYNWVSQNIHNELKLEKIASELCISERTLRRKLAENGTSFSAICLEIKQGFAKKYIKETTLSYDDIAESLGFNDTSNFRRAFKDWTGMTPAQYRTSE